MKGITFKSLNGTALTPADLSDHDNESDLFLVDTGELDDVIEINGTTVTATNGSIAKLRQLAVMANATYDIPLANNTFKPYVGVGLGAVGSHLNVLGSDDGSVRFAWQLRAGAAMKLARGVDLTADYTYRQTSKGKLSIGGDTGYELGKTKHLWSRPVFALRSDHSPFGSQIRGILWLWPGDSFCGP